LQAGLQLLDLCDQLVALLLCGGQARSQLLLSRRCSLRACSSHGGLDTARVGRSSRCISLAQSLQLHQQHRLLALHVLQAAYQLLLVCRQLLCTLPQLLQLLRLRLRLLLLLLLQRQLLCFIRARWGCCCCCTAFLLLLWVGRRRRWANAGCSWQRCCALAAPQQLLLLQHLVPRRANNAVQRMTTTATTKQHAL
jgi:hypothetical protein